jgi:hypothetical protein
MRKKRELTLFLYESSKMIPVLYLNFFSEVAYSKFMLKLTFKSCEPFPF